MNDINLNYYDEIKECLISNEAYKRVKDYSKNRSDLDTYYKVGKLLAQAGNHYGEGIIKKYSIKLTIEFGKKYNERTLRRFRQFYNLCCSQKWSALPTDFNEYGMAMLPVQLSWSHFTELLALKDFNEINYYINISIKKNLTYRELRNIIKSKEYQRLPIGTRNKLVNQKITNVKDLVPNPILINNKNNIDIANEKILHQLIVENITSFMKELGTGYSFIDSEYKIKPGNKYNYIDLLLYNIEFNCYVVIELKVTELKKEHIGQIEVYMNYIDSNLRKINQDKTIGIIICKKDNKFVMEYCSDKRIIAREYRII